MSNIQMDHIKKMGLETSKFTKLCDIITKLEKSINGLKNQKPSYMFSIMNENKVRDHIIIYEEMAEVFIEKMEELVVVMCEKLEEGYPQFFEAYKQQVEDQDEEQE